ncbi:hypothetical protein [Nocardia heshunensis]
MEPVSLGIAAAALLASKFGEGLAKDAGSGAWTAIGHLRDLIVAKLRREVETDTASAALIEGVMTTQSQALVAERIASEARTDPGFARELDRLIAAARLDTEVDLFVAHAYDNARQVNIRGDNTGTINMT